MDFEEFKRKQKNHKLSDDFKFGVVIFMALSVAYFAIVGDVEAKKIVPYWVIFMALLVIISGVLDILAWRKDKITKEIV